MTNVCRYGYRFDHRILNAADYGAYTSRRRFFGIFAKGSLPIVFPEPTHCKEGASGLFGQLKRWKPVREVLDFSDEGESIFGRKKPLVEATLERIYAGLIKFVAGGKDAFLVKYNSMSQRGKYVAPDMEEPSPVVSTQGRLAVAKVNYLCKHFGGSPDGKCSSVDNPAGTITTRDHHSFITAYYGNGHNHSIDAPAPTLTTRDRLAFVDMQYGNGTPCDIDTPAPTVTTNPKHKLVTCKRHKVVGNLFSYQGFHFPDCKHRFLMNPQFQSAGGSVDNPCFTLIARMDKMPPYLIQTEQGEVAIVIDPNDSPAMVKIKEFMALYGIIDIKMRMLRIPELKRIMGFPLRLRAGRDAG